MTSEKSSIRTKISEAVATTTKVSAEKAKSVFHRAAEAAQDLKTANSLIKPIKQWVISLFVKSINSCLAEQDRIDAIAWLATTREIVSDNSLSTTAKAKKVHALTNSTQLAKGILRSVTEAYKNYKNAPMPTAIKVALPVTLSAAAILGGPSVGIAGFGTAIGAPILLVIFLGAAGITSVLEAVLSSPEAKNYVSIVGFMIAKDEVLRRASHGMRKAMSEDIVQPRRQECSPEDDEIRNMLLDMNPYDFEKHVMSFFSDAGMIAWATKKSNDAGVDGFARHPNGLIVVQCKRNAEANSVGRPIVQQFKGVVEENSAWRGFVVTTSHFTAEAIESASKNTSVQLIDLNQLIHWHHNGLGDLAQAD